MNSTKSILLLSACAAFILAVPGGTIAEGKGHGGGGGGGGAKTAERQAKKAENDSTRTEKSNDVTDARQARQEKRIEQGIKKGYLTPDEISKLNAQQATIESMQKQFNSDGKITRDEATQLRSALNDASLDIWTEKHNTDGKQMPVYRLGKDVRLNADVAAKLASDSLSKADARKFLADFHTLIDLRKKLNGSLSDSTRTQLQAQYNSLLSQYFSTVK